MATNILSTGEPAWGNNCWMLGQDIIADCAAMEPVAWSRRRFVFDWYGMHKPGIDVELNTLVYSLEVDYEGVYGVPPGQGMWVWRVEIGEYRGEKVVWVDEIGPTSLCSIVQVNGIGAWGCPDCCTLWYTTDAPAGFCPECRAGEDLPLTPDKRIDLLEDCTQRHSISVPELAAIFGVSEEFAFNAACHSGYMLDDGVPTWTGHDVGRAVGDVGKALSAAPFGTSKIYP